MSEGLVQNQFAGRIEGGIDALVLGANADGLVAAAYLRRAGLKTILLETGTEIGGVVRAREFADGRQCIDGEHLIFALSERVIDELDLYRHGVTYASRRLDTSYFFDDGRMLVLGGDIQTAANGLLKSDAAAFEKLAEHALQVAQYLRPAFHDPTAVRLEKVFEAAPAACARRIVRFAVAPAVEILDEYFEDGPVKTALLSEASFRSAAAPDEAFSFMPLIRRWAGEASGLPGAVAYPRGGATTIIQALRRAAQSAKVEIRAATPVQSILVENDRVAGVELAGGGQIRAPVVIATQNARRVFLDYIGPAHIDVEFQRAATAPAPSVSTARLHLALKGVARDGKTKETMRRRLMFAPGVEALRRAFADARAGRAPEALIIEAIFPAMLDEIDAPENFQTLSVMAHPLPADEDPSAKRRAKIEKAILGNIERFAPDIGAQVEASDLRLISDFARRPDSSALAAKPGVMRQWAQAAAINAAGRIMGLYVCGAETQIGVGLSGAAGRAAAKAAIRAARRGELSP